MTYQWPELDFTKGHLRLKVSTVMSKHNGGTNITYHDDVDFVF